ncbi:hypothetical protein CKAN_01423800 [Cinnamomum micranthum f. kanehirae]|uniref:N-acetyltransferase domain-containing protein n=1 Tax=Cinnamomum micranthum f. kanehirae TaxID=337451 RepID=A0A3S3N4S0_9MAGN|nr:hypothetical protein CKAN_01423800 [Cinnamomum micranthum f. kanehirae]
MESVTPGRLSFHPYEISDADNLMMFREDDRVASFCRFDTLTCREDAVEYLEVAAIPHPWYWLSAWSVEPAVTYMSRWEPRKTIAGEKLGMRWPSSTGDRA